jgi:hypothetical protein
MRFLTLRWLQCDSLIWSILENKSKQENVSIALVSIFLQPVFLVFSKKRWRNENVNSNDVNHMMPTKNPKNWCCKLVFGFCFFLNRPNLLRVILSTLRLFAFNLEVSLVFRLFGHNSLLQILLYSWSVRVVRSFSQM